MKALGQRRELGRETPCVLAVAFRREPRPMLEGRDEGPLGGEVEEQGDLGSSLAFGLVHDRWLLGALTGVVYALVLRRSAKLVDPILAHASSNLVIAVWVLATGNWQHW